MMKLLFFLFFLVPLFFVSYWWFMILSLLFIFFFSFNCFPLFSYWGMLCYYFGGDYISFIMIFLSFWVVLLAILSSGNIFFYDFYWFEFLMICLFLLLSLIFCFGVFNLLLFYVFFESSLIFTLMLIFGWGMTSERLSAGFYLLFYTLFVSLPLLMVVLSLGNLCGSLFYDFILVNWGSVLYGGLIFAFLVKMPMIFVHFWLPKAHVQAPVSGSMILAGVLLKLGGYGLIRVFSLEFLIGFDFSFFFVSLGLFGSLISGVLCLYQVDSSVLIAYSSVSHMGLVICGIFIMNYWGLFGSLILMLGHGLCSSGLFCIVNVVYERLNSRSFLMMSGMISFMPSLVIFWFFFSINNMAAPMSLNFFGEVMLINSIVSWSIFGMLFLFVISFLSCCYSIYLFSYVNYGFYFSGIKLLSSNTCYDYVLVIYHLLPLNFLFLGMNLFIL